MQQAALLIKCVGSIPKEISLIPLPPLTHPLVRVQVLAAVGPSPEGETELGYYHLLTREPAILHRHLALIRLVSFNDQIALVPDPSKYGVVCNIGTSSDTNCGQWCRIHSISGCPSVYSPRSSRSSAVSRPIVVAVDGIERQFQEW